MEAFYWMFKKEEFKKHYKYLCLGTLLLFIIAIATSFALISFQPSNTIIQIIFSIIGGIICVLPIFLSIGYFWELTGNVIDREIEITASQIYDGKIRESYKINLPQLKTGKFLWRGFASTIANALIVFPYCFLIYIALTHETMLNPQTLIMILSVLFFLLMPAMYWNYAKQNSILAGLNISKAVFLMGNYTYRYLKAVLLLALIYAANSFLDGFFIQKLLPTTFGQFNFQDIFSLTGIGLYSIFLMIKWFYLLYVTAYILGTIVPTKEG